MKIVVCASRHLEYSRDFRIHGFSHRFLSPLSAVGLMLFVLAIYPHGLSAQTPLIQQRPLDQTVFVIGYPFFDTLQSVTDSSTIHTEILERIDGQPGSYVIALTPLDSPFVSLDHVGTTTIDQNGETAFRFALRTHTSGVYLDTMRIHTNAPANPWFYVPIKIVVAAPKGLPNIKMTASTFNFGVVHDGDTSTINFSIRNDYRSIVEPRLTIVQVPNNFSLSPLGDTILHATESRLFHLTFHPDSPDSFGDSLKIDATFQDAIRHFIVYVSGQGANKLSVESHVQPEGLSLRSYTDGTTSGVLVSNSSSDMIRWNVVDLLGRSIASGEITSQYGESRLPLPFLRPDTYLLEVSDGKSRGNLLLQSAR